MADVRRPGDLGVLLRRPARDDLHLARLCRALVRGRSALRTRPAVAETLDPLAVDLLHRGRARPAGASADRVLLEQRVSSLPADLRARRRPAVRSEEHTYELH